MEFALSPHPASHNSKCYCKPIQFRVSISHV